MCSDILISLDLEHSENLIAGIKTVELRRRRLSIRKGSRVWIYTKKPRASVNAVGLVLAVHAGSADVLWRKFSTRLAISREHFDRYLLGATEGCAIEFSEVNLLQEPIQLSDLRRQVERFQPPQFFKNLDNDHTTLTILRRHAGLSAEGQTAFCLREVFPPTVANDQCTRQSVIA